MQKIPLYTPYFPLIQPTKTQELKNIDIPYFRNTTLFH